MACIGGIICFDDNKLLIKDSLKLKSALEKEFMHNRSSGWAKFFFVLSITHNPESVHEIQPFYLSKNNAYIVLDGRILIEMKLF